MGERIRGEWIEGKVHNLLMVLRYNKDNLIAVYNGKKYKLNLDCCISFIKRGRLDKVAMTGFIDIEFKNGQILTIIYYPKKRPIKNTAYDNLEKITFSSLVLEIIKHD